MMRCGGWLLGAILCLLALPRPAGCDILPEGHHPIAADFIVEAGKYADFCEYAATVKKGDTIDSIAKAHYGDEKWKDAILKANPGIVPEKLAVGARIKLPPKKSPPEKSDEILAWAFYTYSSMNPPTMPKRIDIGVATPSPGRLPALVAVPLAMVDKFELEVKEAEGRLRGYEFIQRTSGVYFIEDFHINTLVPDASKAVRMTVTFEFKQKVAATKETPAQYTVALKGKTYVDAKGAAVSESGFGMLPIIALLGAGLLVFFARRARVARS